MALSRVRRQQAHNFAPGIKSGLAVHLPGSSADGAPLPTIGRLLCRIWSTGCMMRQTEPCRADYALDIWIRDIHHGSSHLYIPEMWWRSRRYQEAHDWTNELNLDVRVEIRCSMNSPLLLGITAYEGVRGASRWHHSPLVTPRWQHDESVVPGIWNWWWKEQETFSLL